ncbi:hypothetical protein GF367_00355 [Candidatus Woesearchaeota archaeon]|nr:hypothetical protein [Candidatus Woesearchaeota archaeon]
MPQQRAQSSVEYLGTYAWAFLGLIITIGALNYFGVLNPSSYTPERCESGSQIRCTDTYLAVNETSNDHTILLLFMNNYPREIVVENITITNLDPPISTEQQSGIRVKPGRTYTASFNTDDLAFIKGQKERLLFSITYRRYTTGSAVSHNITGDAVINVQDGTTTKQYYCGDGNVDGSRGEECDPPTLTIPATITTQCDGDYCRSDCTCTPLS